VSSIDSRVLFLCTGNYYRSRFAEYLFNHLAATRELPWCAFSRGLAIELVDEDAGPISPFTLEGLARWGITTESGIRAPIQASPKDFVEADLVVALKQAEHLPLIRRRYPGWEDRVEFWHVDDIDVANPRDALPVLESLIHGLLDRLA
jgi:protein-tyrosine phosphatase